MLKGETPSAVEVEAFSRRERVAKGDEWEPAAEIPSGARELLFFRMNLVGRDWNLSRFAGVNESPQVTSGSPQAKS